MIATDINDKKKTWLRHKEEDKKGIKDLSKHNSDLILEFLNDYEKGLNVGMFKGRRTPSTLTKLRHQLIFFCRRFEKDLDKVDNRELHKLFFEMEEGTLTKKTGSRYLGVGEFVKSSKSFYGWLMRTKKIKDNPTSDLSISVSNGNGRKPNWVYLGNEKMKELINQARGDYRAIILFLYDSGLRPQEAWRIRISDFDEDLVMLDIPKLRSENKENVSKTFARKLKLTQSSNLLKTYVKMNNLSGDDLLIGFQQKAFNDYIGRLAKRLFGDKPTKARGKPEQFKSYDIRHNSACYYLDKYRTNAGMMKRFGWKKEDKIFYYTEFLGKGDNIDEDMMTTEDKNKVVELEKEVEGLNKRYEEAIDLAKQSMAMVKRHSKNLKRIKPMLNKDRTLKAEYKKEGLVFAEVK